MTHPRARLARSLLAATLAGLFSVVALQLTASPARAQQAAPGDYGTEATLIDGVEGLDPYRKTTIESEVWAIEAVDDLMLVGGAFTHVRDRSNFDSIPRPYLAAFDPTTGEYVPWWSTQPNGTVYDIIDLGNGQAALMGEFTSVNGVANTNGFAVVDVATGNVDTRYAITLGGEGVVRAGARHGDRFYLAGGFSSINTGQGTIATGGLARISLNSGRADAGWTPELRGGGAWGIGVASFGRVFVGGYFESVDGVAGTETLAALSSGSGSVVGGWNHGFPHDQCTARWRATCGAINGLAVVDDRVFVAGAKHFWAALSVTDGTILADREITNDGQAVDEVDGMVMVGCHCSTPITSDEWNNIEDRYVRLIDPVQLTEVASPTVNTEGAAGGWAAAAAPDGCLWTGGNFSSTRVGGVSKPAWSLLRFCGPQGGGSNPVIQRAPNTDVAAPSRPGAPTIAAQRASTIDLSWPASSDNSGQVAYLIYRNGELVGRTAATSYSDALLDPNAVYEWRVSAYDMSGNISDPSAVSTPVRIGPRYNIAPGRTVTMSPAAAASSGANKAIDGTTNGNLASGSVARTVTVPGDDQPWWNIDLGAVRNIDFVRVYPRTDGNGFNETNNRLRIYFDTTPVSGTSLALLSSGGHRVWTGNRLPEAPRLEQADLAQPGRYLRFISSASRLSLAEVQIYTVDPAATPQPLPTDTSRPNGPSWKKTINVGDNSVLRWGGATDNVAVAYYEVFKNGTLIGRTSDRSLPVGAPNQAASSFTIGAVDAAGNSSLVNQPNNSDEVIACSAVRNGTTVTVSWNAAANPEKFVVRRTFNGSPSYWRGAPTGASRVFTDTDRVGSLVYTVESRNGTTSGTRVTCANGGGGGQFAPPSGCTWTQVGGVYNVEWSAPATADSVIVQRRVNGGTWWWRARVNTPQSSFIDTTKPGTITYRVQAKYGETKSVPATCTKL